MVTMKKMGGKTGLRQRFIDNIEDENAIRNQLNHLAVMAKDRDTVIGIGHCRSITLKVLQEVLPSLKDKGYQLISVSEAVF